jgi:cytochrome c oxidase subunit II
LKVVTAATTLLALAGCEGALSTVDPAGPAARTIAALWWVMLFGAALIFALVMVLLVLSFRRRREGRGRDQGRQVRIWIVGLGLVFPMAVLAGLLAYGLVVGERLLPRDSDSVVSVGAEGRRWTWTFTYEDAPERTTEGVLHIPAGRAVDVAITSADVIHSFWVPRLAGKLDAIPGHVNVLRIEADEPGTYRGVSAEFSGGAYARFTFAVTAHDADGWDAFVGGEPE